MKVTLVRVRVKPECVEAFVAATRKNHEGAIREAGNLRFDVLQSPRDPGLFLLYEAYADDASSARHKETAHYQAWREAVADMMQEPRQGDPWIGLMPR